MTFGSGAHRARGPASSEWPSSGSALDAEQQRLGALVPPPWLPPAGRLEAAGCFLAFARGEQGPGHAGDRGWSAAAVVGMPDATLAAVVVVPVVAGSGYEWGRLALREGPALAAAVTGLPMRPAVLLVDATGRDHPRGAGLALHLGAVLDIPTVGVTHRPMLARGRWPPDELFASAPLFLDGVVVGGWLRTRRGARPLAVHAAWRTDAHVALDVVRRCVTSARTPEPLRQARGAARVARARAEGRIR